MSADCGANTSRVTAGFPVIVGNGLRLLVVRSAATGTGGERECQETQAGDRGTPPLC